MSDRRKGMNDSERVRARGFFLFLVFFLGKQGWTADILKTCAICKGSLLSVLEDFLSVFLSFW